MIKTVNVSTMEVSSDERTTDLDLKRSNRRYYKMDKTNNEIQNRSEKFLSRVVNLTSKTSPFPPFLTVAKLLCTVSS